MNTEESFQDNQPPAAQPRKKKNQWIFLRVIFYLAAALLTIAVGMFLLLQTGSAKNKIREMVSEIISQNTMLKCRIGDITGNIFAGFTIKDVDISDAETGASILSSKSVHVSYNAPMLMFGMLRIHRLDVDTMSVNLLQSADGTWNVQKVFAGNPTGPVKDSSNFQLAVRRVSAAHSSVCLTQWTDAGPVTHHITGIDLSLSLSMGKTVSARIYQLAFQSDIPRVTLTNLTGDIGFDAKNRSLIIKDADINTPLSSLNMKGRVDFVSGGPKIDVQTDIKTLTLSEIADVLSVKFPETGTVSGALTVNGTLEELHHQLDMKWEQCEVRSEGWTAYNATDGFGFDVSAKISHLNPAAIPVDSMEKLPGNINADVSVKWDHFYLSDQTARASVDVKESEIAGYSVKDANIVVALSGHDLTIEKIALDSPYGKISGSGTVTPVTAGKDHRIDVNADVCAFNPAALLKSRQFAANINAGIRSSFVIPGTFMMKDCAGNASIRVNPSQIQGIEITQGELDAAWSGYQVTINRIYAQGPAGQTDVSGTISLQDRLCQIKAAATFPDLKLIGSIFPDFLGNARLSGALKADGEIAGKWDQPHTKASVSGEHICFEDVAADALNLTAEFDGSLNDFKGSGDCKANGFKLKSIRIPTVSLQTQVQPDNARLVLALEGEKKEHFDLSGDVHDWLKATKEILVDHIAFTSEDLPPLVNDGPVKISISMDRLNIEALQLHSEDASIALKGYMGLTASNDLAAELTLRDFDLKRISGFWTGGERISGRVSSNIGLKGSADNPEISIDASLTEGAYRDFEVSKVSISASYKDALATVKAEGFQKNNKIVDANGSVPLKISLYPFEFIPQTNSMNIAVNVEQVHIADISALKNRDYDSDGIISASVNIVGDLNNPLLEGQMKLSDGFINLKKKKLSYENITAVLKLEKGRVEIVSMGINGDKEGNLNFSGFLTYDHFNITEFNIHVTGDNFYVPYETGIEARTKPDLLISGSLKAPNLTGNVLVTKGRVNLDWFYQEEPSDILVIQPVTAHTGTIEIPEKQSQTLSIFDSLSADIRVSIPGNVWLKGASENIEIDGSLNVKKEPHKSFLLYGPLNAIRGTYQFSGKLFKITSGELNFLGQEEINPPLSVDAETTVSNVKIIIHLTGTFEKLNLTLDSDPVMDQVDVISYLVFGQPSTSLSSKESFQAEGAALSITSQMAANQLRDILGDKFAFDYLDFNTGSGDIAKGSLSMGKYLAPKVFVIYRHGFSQDTPRQVEVDYEINRNFNLQTQIDNEQTSAVDLIWKYEF